MKVMLEEMERHYGKRPIIYTTVDFYEAILSDGAFSDYPIWVRSTKHHPAVKYGSRAWAFWQYQSDGQTPGINGNVDRDVFYGTQEQWQAFLAASPLAAARAPADRVQDGSRPSNLGRGRAPTAASAHKPHLLGGKTAPQRNKYGRPCRLEGSALPRRPVDAVDARTGRPPARGRRRLALSGGMRRQS